jgi:hypothetical protein
MDEVTGGWRKMHNESLHDLNSSSIIIIIVKSRRMRWAGHMARMGEKRNVYRLLVGKRPLGRQDVGGWITLTWILQRLAWLRIGTNEELL